MKHDRELAKVHPRYALDEAAKVMAASAARFAAPEVSAQIAAACDDAGRFLKENTWHYQAGKQGAELLKGPFLTKENIEKLRNPDKSKYTAFTLGRSKENARQRIIANGINHALVVLSEAPMPVFAPKFLQTEDPLIFDIAGEAVMQELQLRHEIKHKVPVMTLIEAVRMVYPNASKQRQWHMRDVATTLAQTGLLTGSYSLGEGYCLRPGPLLTEVFARAINPALTHFNAY